MTKLEAELEALCRGPAFTGVIHRKHKHGGGEDIISVGRGVVQAINGVDRCEGESIADLVRRAGWEFGYDQC